MSVDRGNRLEKLREYTHRWLDDPSEDRETAALVEAAFLMAAADGRFGNAEQDEFAEALQFLSAGKLTLEQIDGILDELIDALRTDGWDARIASVASQLASPESRRNAYRMAAGISFSDGTIQDEEQRLFGLLADAFEIPTDEASTILREVRDLLYPEE
jgi:tellurite resistance protein